ncbi:MAG: PAQR family membrane homeostasis protein TrhA [Thalassotalea sp.]
MITKNANYSWQEELANAISHGIGALLSVAGLTLLVMHAIAEQSTVKIVSFAIYGSTLVVLFSASTLYHALVNPAAKRILKKVDHCAIYLLIAGTYTPLMLITVQGSIGLIMLVIIWLLALAGIIFKISTKKQHKFISLSTYLGMGFISLLIIQKLNQALATGGMVLLTVGGLVYAFGVIFYANKNIPFNHAIWHLFVLAGAACHFTLILLYV